MELQMHAYRVRVLTISLHCFCTPAAVTSCGHCRYPITAAMSSSGSICALLGRDCAPPEPLPLLLHSTPAICVWKSAGLVAAPLALAGEVSELDDELDDELSPAPARSGSGW